MRRNCFISWSWKPTHATYGPQILLRRHYFRGGDNAKDLDFLIDENLIATNDIILSELIPYLMLKKQNKVIKLLYEINKLPLDIRRDEIIEYQVRCLKYSANGIGTPDLIIALNSKQNFCKVYSIEKHFQLFNQVLQVNLHV